jgi:hypothetical protein
MESKDDSLEIWKSTIGWYNIESDFFYSNDSKNGDLESKF